MKIMQLKYCYHLGFGIEKCRLQPVLQYCCLNIELYGFQVQIEVPSMAVFVFRFICTFLWLFLCLFALLVFGLFQEGGVGQASLSF